MIDDIRRKKREAKSATETEVQIYAPQVVMAKHFQEAMHQDESEEASIDPDTIPQDQATVEIEPDREDSDTEDNTTASTELESTGQQGEMSLYDKAEALRTYLENKLGMDTLIEAYMIVKEIDENETYESYEDRLEQTLTLEQLDAYLPLVRTLIYLDNFLQ